MKQSVIVLIYLVLVSPSFAQTLEKQEKVKKPFMGNTLKEAFSDSPERGIHHRL